MTHFTRIRKGDRHYNGQFAEKGTGVPHPLLNDKNRSHSGQGARNTVPDQEADLGQEQAGDQSAGSEENQQEQQDTTSQ